MSSQDFILTRVFDAPRELVWKAITERERMQHWYFDPEEFRAEPGFEFRFSGGTKDRRYLHVCEITEVVPETTLAYTWRYDGHPGVSVVRFDLSDEDGRTRLTLTHSGLETFPADNPDFARENFAAGWHHIIGTSLQEYLASIRETEA